MESNQKKQEYVKAGIQKRIWFQNFSKNLLQQQNISQNESNGDGPNFSSKYNVFLRARSFGIFQITGSSPF